MPLRSMFRSLGLLTLLLFGAESLAADNTDAELEQLRDRVIKNLPDVRRENIQRSPATGLFEIRIDNAFGYVTSDGRYLVAGDVIDMSSGERITERRRGQTRLQEIEKLQAGAIEFAPPPDQLKRWITVFTDVDCEYCRLLHREVPELNRRGIGVRYLFFSKYGAPSEAADRAQQIWCSKDRHEVLDHGLLTGELPKKKPRSLCKNPVIDQYLAASRMGLRGTPMTVLADGSVFAGYTKAAELVAEIDKREAAAAQFSQAPVTTP